VSGWRGGRATTVAAGARPGAEAGRPRSDPGRRRRWLDRFGSRQTPGAEASSVAGVARVAALMRSGARPADAWRHGLGVACDGTVPSYQELVARCGGDASAAVAVVAAAELSTRVGAAPAAMLDGVAAALARDADAAAQRTAALAGPRATARLLGWLPVVGIVLGAALGADPLTVLLDGRGGTLLLVLGAGLTLAGRLWTRRYVGIAADAGRQT
jgi:tight adherence protein B